MTAQFKIEGVEGIQRVLEGLPREIQRTALVDAFTQGANVVKDEARAQAFALWPDSFANKIVVNRPGAGYRGFAGSRQTVVVVALKLGKYSKLAHLFEFGTVERHHQSGKRTGKITAAPVLRPSLDRRAGDAVQKIAAALEKNIEVLVARLRRGQKLSLSKAAREEFDG